MCKKERGMVKMSDNVQKRIAMVGAGGMSFGPVMTHDVIHSEKLEGSTLVLVDMDEKNLEVARAAACRLNDAMGNPILIEAETDTARGVSGADFVMVSAEIGRWKGWKQDFEIPRKHGSSQIMGENGGPGAVFHSLRSINNVLDICSKIEQNAPDAFVLNLTNPMSRVTLAINKGTKLRNVGLCHEFVGGLLHLSIILLMPPERISAAASGTNHFTWFYKIEDADTGEDLYPKVGRHMEMFPFLHSKLIRRCYREFGRYPTSTDSHIGEYLPFVAEEVKPIIQFHDFFRNEGKLRYFLTEQYGKGSFWLPVKMIPKSSEEVIPIIEALATNDSSARFNAVNVPNKGYIPNLPDGALIEVSSGCDGMNLAPDTVPAIDEPLAELMRVQIKLQEMIVDSVLKRDPELAFEALAADPLAPPSREACRNMFDEMSGLQRDQLPFD
jgi:alpha-galactosidase